MTYSDERLLFIDRYIKRDGYEMYLYHFLHTLEKLKLLEMKL